MGIHEHISELKIDTFAVNPDLLDENERIDIEKHLSECAFCRDYYTRLKNFYSGLEQKLESSPGEKDRELAVALLRKKGSRLLPSKALEKTGVESLIETYTDIVSVSRRGSLPQRLYFFVQSRPVVSAAAMFALVAILSITFLIYRESGDSNPAYALVQNYQLRVYNQDSELLWTKPALGMPDLSSATWKSSRDDGWRYLMVEDIDGNGVKEVLLVYSADRNSANDTLACYNYDGSLRWKGELPEPIRYGDKEQTRFIHWQLRDFITIRKNKDHRNQLFVIAASLLNPSILFELDPLTGTLLQTYWNNGHINHLHTFDVESDGNTEIVIGGINNPYENAFVSVLDPLNISGYGPTREEDIPHSVDRAQPIFYILFPKSSVSESWNTVRYNSIGVIEVIPRPALLLHVNELPGRHPDEQGGIIYYFDDSMRVTNVTHTAPFRSTHRRLVDEGILNDTLNEDYLNNLKRSIRYWDGERFVNEWVRNRLYRERVPS
jgi:hypothetical protein